MNITEIEKQVTNSNVGRERESNLTSKQYVNCVKLKNYLNGVISKEKACKNTYTTVKKKVQLYYAVHGENPGVYRTWNECRKQMNVAGTVSYRKFCNEKLALEYARNGYIDKFRTVASKRKRDGRGEIECTRENPGESSMFVDEASEENGEKRVRIDIGIKWGLNHPLNASKWLSINQRNTCSDIKEAIYALNQAKQIGAHKVKIYTDNNYFMQVVADWTKKLKKINEGILVYDNSLANKDFLEFKAVIEGLYVEWIYVESHERSDSDDDDDDDEDEADREAAAEERILLEPSNYSTFPKPQIGPEIVNPLSTVSNLNEKMSKLVISGEEKERKTFYSAYIGEKIAAYKTHIEEREEQIKVFVKAWFKKLSKRNKTFEFVKYGEILKKIESPIPGPDKFVSVFINGVHSCNEQEQAEAGIGVYWGPGNNLNTSMRLSGKQTNDRAEIISAVHALQQAKKQNSMATSVHK
ncbi:ribonuclease H1 [Caerostris extrusa]|uniref:ribonuclease H n=1 Tax=Caerostris extrusa TaxID=172846 RepID=A0AAV4NHW3_CAEEX|nr:ribonuclease H1 [Caerostris extrusa]